MAIADYYICNKCPFRTTLLSRINDHFLEHFSTKQPSPFSYFDCFDRLKPLKCSTESLILLRYHLVRKHDQQQFALKATLKTCKKCGFGTHSNYLWNRHCNISSCRCKNRSKGKKNVRVVIKKYKKWHLCEKCDYRTANLRDFKHHVINKHTPLEEINWQYCNKCPAKFKTFHSLKKHQKYVHTSAVDHLNCPECDYSTPSRQSLKTHFNNKHARSEDIKWMECHECVAKFKDKYKLKRHLLVHTTKDKEFKCDQCPFETYYTHNLNRHIIGRHLKKETTTKYEKHLENHILVKHDKDGDIFQCKQCHYNK